MVATHSLIFIPLLVVLGAAKWSPLTRIHTSTTINPMYIRDEYVDHGTNLHHMLALYPRSYAAVQYWKVSGADGKILSQTALNATLYKDPASASLVGDGKGHLYIFISAFTKIDIMATKAIFFSESADDGKTWTPLTMMPKPSVDYSLVGLSAKVIKETGRLFLFYHAYCLESGKDDIRFATRAPGSIVFSQERTIHNVSMFPYDIVRVEYSLDAKGHVTLHLFWSNYNREMYYTRSEDNGVVWTSPFLIPETKENLFGCFPFALAYDPTVSPAILGAYTRNNQRLFYTLDAGRSFNGTVGRDINSQTTACYYPQRALTICGKAAYRLEMVEKGELTYTRYNLTTMKGEELARPEIEGVSIETGIRATCEDGKMTVVFSGLNVGNESVIAIARDTIS